MADTATIQEITLLEAIYRMRRHHRKKEPISFTVTFDNEPGRTARFGKVWRKVEQQWMYFVKDGPYTPSLGYDERTAVSAIMRIKGMGLDCNIVHYHIFADGGNQNG